MKNTVTVELPNGPRFVSIRTKNGETFTPGQFAAEIDPVPLIIDGKRVKPTERKPFCFTCEKNRARGGNRPGAMLCETCFYAADI